MEKEESGKNSDSHHRNREMERLPTVSDGEVPGDETEGKEAMTKPAVLLLALYEASGPRYFQVKGDEAQLEATCRAVLKERIERCWWMGTQLVKAKQAVAASENGAPLAAWEFLRSRAEFENELVELEIHEIQ